MDFDKATKIKKKKNPLGEIKVIEADFVDGAGIKIQVDIPMKEANTDYQNLLKWAAIDGNNIEEAD